MKKFTQKILCLCNKILAVCVVSTLIYSGVYFFRNIFIQRCIFSGIYLFRSLFFQEYIYSGVYLFKDIYIQGYIYSGIYLFRCIFIQGIVIQGCLILACVVTLLLVSVVFVHACTATAFPLLSRISAKARDILGLG